MEMENNETRVEETNQDDRSDYIAAIKELKENSVSKEAYTKLKEENKKLLNSLVRGETIEAEKVRPSVEELRGKLFGKKELNNLEFAKAAVDLRDALIENGEKDPFLPWGKKVVPDASDFEAADRVASVFKECIDYADGDPEIFTQELQRRTIDTAPPIKNKYRR